MLKTVIMAILPLVAAVAATAAVALHVGDITGFLFGGEAVGWQRLVVIVVLFLPIAMTFAITECFVRPGCRGLFKRD